VEIVNRVHNQGYDIKEYYKALMDQFRNLLIGLVAPRGDLLDVSDDESNEIRRQGKLAGIQKVQQCLNLLIAGEEDLKFTSHPRLVLETMMIKLCRLGEVLSFDDLIQKVGALEERLSGAAPSGSGTEDQAPPGRLAEDRIEWGREETEAEASQPSAKNSRRDWEGLLQFLQTKNGPMANILKGWRLLGLSDDVIEISRGASAFSSSYLDEPERLAKLAEYCQEFFGREIKIKIVAKSAAAEPEGGEAEEPKPTEVEQNPIEAAPPVRNVLEVFEGQIKAKVPAKRDTQRAEGQKKRRKEP
jgi:DNA polymerase-3 subunit gamma/tau